MAKIEINGDSGAGLPIPSAGPPERTNDRSLVKPSSSLPDWHITPGDPKALKEVHQSICAMSPDKRNVALNEFAKQNGGSIERGPDGAIRSISFGNADGNVDIFGNSTNNNRESTLSARCVVLGTGRDSIPTNEAVERAKSSLPGGTERAHNRAIKSEKQKQ